MKRRGYDVRARAGTGRRKPPTSSARAPPPRPPSCRRRLPPRSGRSIRRSLRGWWRFWTGSWPLPANGRAAVTVAWTPVSSPGTEEPAALSVRVTQGAGPAIEQTVERGGTRFDVAAGPVQLAFRILDKSGEVLDRDTRRVEAMDTGNAPLALTAVVHRAENPAALRGVPAEALPVHAGREFLRTDRLLIRVRPYGTAAENATVTAASDRSPRRAPRSSHARGRAGAVASHRSAARLDRAWRLRGRDRGAERGSAGRDSGAAADSEVDRAAELLDLS